MDKDELIFWNNKYDVEAFIYNTGIEEELKKKFQKNNFMNKSDLVKIVKWKFQGRLLGRQKRTLNLLKNIDDAFIKNVSQSAFRSQDDKNRLELLSSIKGVRNALSSVILSFYDPENYGILDIHSWRGLFGEKEPSNVFANIKYAIKFFEKLRECSHETGLPCRTIEKAFFMKDLDESMK